MNSETRNIVNYYELTSDWQDEALSNLGAKQALEALYLEPLEDQNPFQHVLYDLTEAMRMPSGSKYHAVIGISNCLALGLVFDDTMEQVTVSYL